MPQRSISLPQTPACSGRNPLPHLAPDALHPNAPFLTIVQLRALSVYTRLAERQTGTSPNTTPEDPADIQGVLTAFNAALLEFPPTSDPAMARVLNVPTGLVVGRFETSSPWRMSRRPHSIQIDRAAQLASAIGVDSDTFAALISNDYDTLLHAADALIAVLRSRITDQTAADATLEQLEQPVREAKRDALADYLINSITPKIWSTFNDLYEFFLIVTLHPARAARQPSLVVAATMSAAADVYRALMTWNGTTVRRPIRTISCSPFRRKPTPSGSGERITACGRRTVSVLVAGKLYGVRSARR